MLTAQNITETSDSDGIRDSEGGGEPVRLVARPTFPANASGNHSRCRVAGVLVEVKRRR